MSCNRNAIHINASNSITTWQEIIGDPKKNRTMAEILRDILKKVDKEAGKCLIPVEELDRLRTLYNYDDTYIQGQIRNIHELLDGLDVDSIRQQLYSIELALYDLDRKLRSHEQRIETLEYKVDHIPTTDDIPTKVSQLQNDVPYAKKSEVPTRVSELDNDAGFVNEEECEFIAGSTISDIGGVVFVVED